MAARRSNAADSDGGLYTSWSTSLFHPHVAMRGTDIATRVAADVVNSLVGDVDLPWRNDWTLELPLGIQGLASLCQTGSERKVSKYHREHASYALPLPVRRR